MSCLVFLKAQVEFFVVFVCDHSARVPARLEKGKPVLYIVNNI